MVVTRRVVHPVCDRTCTHDKPDPGSPPEPQGVDWPAVQSMVDDGVRSLPPMPELEEMPKSAVMDMSRMWNPPATAPYPAPTVTSRDGAIQPHPRTVATLVRDMSDAGWTVMVQYAHGAMPHSVTGRPLTALPSWAVRAYRGTWHAVAVYRGKWDTLYGWTDQQTHTKQPNITEFRRWALRDDDGLIAR